VIEIWETDEDRCLSIGQLKHHYLKIAKSKFQGKVFINKDTQKPIKVSKDGIMEWWRKSRRREHIISVQSLDLLLENAVFIEEISDYMNRSRIISASHFECKCNINAKTYKVVITTRKAIYDIDKFRYYTLKNIEIT